MLTRPVYGISVGDRQMIFFFLPLPLHLNFILQAEKSIKSRRLPRFPGKCPIVLRTRTFYSHWSSFYLKKVIYFSNSTSETKVFGGSDIGQGAVISIAIQGANHDLCLHYNGPYRNSTLWYY
jgi:hypothetical protein